MQVDEEAKGAPKDLEFGGYDSDSEDEREKRELEDDKADYAVTFTDAGKAELAKQSKLLIVNCLHSQTMVNIMFGKHWAKAAEGTSTSSKGEKGEKTKTVFTLNQLVEANGVVYFLLPDLQKQSGDAVNPLSGLLFEQIKNVSQITVLRSLYKTAYPAAADLGELPIITHQTSYCGDELKTYLKTKVGTPAHFIAPAGVLGAAAMVHAEMNGLAGYIATLITDSHYVSSESMAGFGSVISQVGVTAVPSDLSTIA